MLDSASLAWNIHNSEAEYYHEDALKADCSQNNESNASDISESDNSSINKPRATRSATRFQM